MEHYASQLTRDRRVGLKRQGVWWAEVCSISIVQERIQGYLGNMILGCARGSGTRGKRRHGVVTVAGRLPCKSCVERATC